MPSHVGRRHKVNALGGSEVAIGQQGIESTIHGVRTDSTYRQGARARNFVFVNENGIFSTTGGPGLCAVIKSTASGRAGWLY